MYRTKAPGKGSTSRGDGRQYGDQRRIVVSFSQETFEVIRERALKEGGSFAEQVRTLVEWGLEADEA